LETHELLGILNQTERLRDVFSRADALAVIVDGVGSAQAGFGSGCPLRKHHFLLHLGLGRSRRGDDVPRDFHHALQFFADAFEVFLRDVFAAFAELLADVFLRRAQHLFVAHAGLGSE
jgi:hypothetical protein